MKKLIKCKVCGYVMEEGSLKDVCPVCGVPKTAFEPFTSKVSEKRENILNLHIHPILVHMPVGFSILLIILLISEIILSPFKQQIETASIVIGVILPAFILFAIISGFFDGLARYKKLKSPFLKIKIILSFIFFLLSSVCSVLIILGLLNLILMFCFSISFLICSTILGRVGVDLMQGKFPG